MHKIFYELCPTYLKNFVPLKDVYQYCTITSKSLIVEAWINLHLPIQLLQIWNSLPECLRVIEKPQRFKVALKNI